MAARKVIVTDYVFESFDTEKEALSAVGAELEAYQCKSADELIPYLAGTHVILNTYLPGIGKKIFDHAPDLKAVVRYGIGLDTIDVVEATRHGVMVACVPDYCINEVADHALALFLALARKINLSDKKVKVGEWSLAYVKPLKSIQQMRAGIIGFGRIGRAIASRLKPFGAEIVFFDPMIKTDVDDYRHIELDELLMTSDAIFAQCPAGKATHHLINRQAVEKMEKKPILINCARGTIVETDALVWGLENGRVGGAGLDLLEDESIVKHDHPIKNFDNVVLTPHSAWYSDAALPCLRRKAIEEVVRVLRGEKPKSLINPEVLERRPQ